MTQTDPAMRSLTSTFRPLLLVACSILILPASLLALFYNYAALALCPQDGLRRHVKRSIRFRPRKIIITGVSTPAGLRVARALHATGHDVIGVECRSAFVDYARWSRAVRKFYTIVSPDAPGGEHQYAENLFRLIVREMAHIWVDCSDGQFVKAQARAKHIIEERSACLCLVPSLEQVQQFQSRQGFQQLAHQFGLPSSETHSIRSRHDIYNILNNSSGKRYLLSSPNGTSEPTTRTILPKRTVGQTYQDVAQLKVTKSTPWTLEEYKEGLQHFTACAIIVQGRLKAFAASSSSEHGDYRSLPTKSGLSDAMKQYMEAFANAVGPSLSSHLTVEFCLDEKATQAGVVQQILPINGHLSPHESLLLFEGKTGSIDLTRAYLTLISTKITELEVYTGLPHDESSSETMIPAEANMGVYFLYRNLKLLTLDPLLQMLLLQRGVSSVLRAVVTFLQHLVVWQEILYEFSDPLPLFWYTHVYAPYQIIAEIAQTAWFRTRSLRRRFGQRRHGTRHLQNGQAAKAH